MLLLFSSISRRSVLLAISFAVFAGVFHAWAQEAVAASSTAEAHLGAGYDALKKEQYERSATEFKAALALNPSLAERARFPLAVALFEAHQSAESRREFESLRRDFGEHPNVVYYLGRLDLDAGDLNGAIENLSQAVAKPPFPDTSYYLGIAYFKQKDWAAAEKWLKAAAQLMPRDSRVSFQLAKVYREQGHEEEAKRALAESAELRQHEDDELRLRQECARKLEQGSPGESVDSCRQLYDPDDAEKLTSLGTIYGQHNDLQGALKCFQRAAELEPQSPQMQYNLALTYYQLKQYERARAPLKDALERWPDLFQLNALYGAVLVKLGEDISAYHALHHAHELSPQDSGTLDFLYMEALQLARKNQESKEYVNSLQYLREAAELRPEEPEPHRRMAEIYSLIAHAAEAAAERQKADRLSKNSLN